MRRGQPKQPRKSPKQVKERWFNRRFTQSRWVIFSLLLTAALFLFTWGLSFRAMYISVECRMHIEAIADWLMKAFIIAMAVGGLAFVTAMGLLGYWLSSDSKDEPIEKDIKDIKTEIRGIRRELQKLPTAIAAILKHSPENADLPAKQRRTKPKTRTK